MTQEQRIWIAICIFVSCVVWCALGWIAEHVREHRDRKRYHAANPPSTGWRNDRVEVIRNVPRKKIDS